jgi:hypothetical protein
MGSLFNLVRRYVSRERAVLLNSLIETWKLGGLDPEPYHRGVRGRIADHPINRLGELPPWRWAQLRRQPPSPLEQEPRQVSISFIGSRRPR